MRISRTLAILAVAVFLAGILAPTPSIAAEPSPGEVAEQALAAPRATAYVVIGQIGTATIDAFAAHRVRTAGSIHAYDSGVGYLAGVVVGARQAADGTITLNGRGRLVAGDGAVTPVRFVLTANPASRAVTLELTKVQGGGSAGKLSGTLTNGLIRVTRPGQR